MKTPKTDLIYRLKIQNTHFEDVMEQTKGFQTIVSRHLTRSEVELDNHCQTTPLMSGPLKVPEELLCYPCMAPLNTTHPVYIFSCNKCGNNFQELRYLERSLSGCIALVTGGRIKLGHQIVLKLLRAGGTVIATTRSPKKAIESFSKYSDWESWKDRLVIYSDPLDFDSGNIAQDISKLVVFIGEKFGRLDILVNCAAQTIRCREKDKKELSPNDETNRYSEPKFVKETFVNSWQMKLSEIVQSEMEEVYRVNAIAPCLMIQGLISLLELSKLGAYIINVNSREGLFDVGNKSKKHIHLNMAKSGMAQMHRTLVDSGYKTKFGEKFHIHLCDPGWISIDEYYESEKPWPVPPLDEIDGAARILYPLWMELPSQRKTRRHFNVLCY